MGWRFGDCLHNFCGGLCWACDNPTGLGTEMMAGTQKKVVVRLLDGKIVSGYLPASGFVESGIVDLMDTAGRSISLRVNDIKLIAYVRDFNSGDPADPEKLGRRMFLGRPRMEGLWVRLTFLDGEILEGICGSEIGFLHETVALGGLLLSPPDPRANTQRIYVPREALRQLELLAVIGSGLKKKPAAGARGVEQPGLFEEG